MDMKELRRFLVSKSWANGRELVRHALLNQQSRHFVEYALDLRHNRKTRRDFQQVQVALRRVDRGAKAQVWYGVFEKELYMLWRMHRHMSAPRLQCPSDGTLRLSKGARRDLACTGIVKCAQKPLKEAAEQCFSTLWADMATRSYVIWMDNWYKARFLNCPVDKNKSLDVSVLAALPYVETRTRWIGHPSLEAAVHRIAIVVQNICVSQHSLRMTLADFLMLPVVADTSIRAPLDVCRPARRTLQWRPLMISNSRTGTKIELVELLKMLCQVQGHIGRIMPLLSDSNIHYQLLKLMHSKYLQEYDFGKYIEKIPLIYGVWHAYKNVVLMFFRRWLPILVHIMNSVVEPNMKVYCWPKLITVEKLVAALWVHSFSLRSALREKIALYKWRTRPHPELTADGLRWMEALQVMLEEYVPALFCIGTLVRNCHWDGRALGSASNAKQVLLRCTVLQLKMAMGFEHRIDYIRTTTAALLHWSTWHDDGQGILHSEEVCEAMLSRLSSMCRQHPQMWSKEGAEILYQSLPRTKFAKKAAGIMPARELFTVKVRLQKFLKSCGREYRHVVRWGSTSTVCVSSDLDRVANGFGPNWPHSLAKDFNQEKLTLLVKGFLRCLAGGSRPSAAVEQWVHDNVPRRSLQDATDYRAALQSLGGQPAVPQRRRLPAEFVQRDRRNRPIVVDEAAPPPPVVLLDEDAAVAIGRLDAVVVSDG
jgi:hypothetical protein